MEKKRIVWIDDEINTLLLKPYVDAFEDNNFEVIKIETIDNLLPILKIEAEKSLSAIIVDIIMPPRHLDFSETEGGLRTGIVIIKDLLKEDFLKSIPIVVLTNVNDVAVNVFCKHRSISCLKKKDYFSDEFVLEIEEIIKK